MFDGISVIFFWSDTTSSGMTEALYQRSRIKLQFVESKWFVVIFIFENQHEKSNKTCVFIGNTRMMRKKYCKKYIIEF